MRNLFLRKAHSLSYVTDEKVNLSLFHSLSEGWLLKRVLDSLSLAQVARYSAQSKANPKSFLANHKCAHTLLTVPCIKKIIPLFLVVLALTGCKTTQSTHGQIIGERQLNAINIGVHQKADVRAILGSPSTTSTLNDNRWYYITSTSQIKPAKGSVISNRKVYIADFDDKGTLTAFTERTADKDGQAVSPDTAQTPTQGEKLGVIEQFLGNVGLKP